MSPENMKIVPERDDPAPIRSGSSGSSGGNGLIWFAVVLLIAGIGAVYFQNTQLAARVEQQQASLTQATQRIQLLEDELTATGRDLSKSGNTLEKRLEASELEIRKLWDLSNKRNKVDIANNEETLKKLAKEIKALEDTQKEQQLALTDEMATRENMDKALQTEQQVFNQRLTTASTELNKLNQKQAQLSADLAEVKKKLANIDSKAIQSVEEKLSVYDERLDAVDASRRQLTSNVTRLNTDVNNLQLEVNALIKAGQSQPSTAVTPAQ